MNTRRTIAGLVLVAVIPVAAGPIRAADHPAAGRWNLTVNPGTYRHPAWLAVEKKDGKYAGRFLPGAGSVRGIGEVKIEGSTLKFNADGHQWTGTVKGDTITGTRVNDKGEKSTWTGQRSVHEIDVTGKWYLKYMPGPVEHPLVLELSHQGDEITGKLSEGGKTTNITGARLRGGLLGFSVAGPSGRRRYTSAVKGDVLEGTVGGAGGARRFAAYRRREWGGPIELFNGKDLNNWKPLGDPNNFHWKVIDGIMTNTGGGGSANIVSKQEFRDFKLYVEFKVPPHGNSGVYLRGRHEIQIDDAYGGDPSWHMCGALYSRIPPNVNAARENDQWQTFDITLVGAYLTVVHNGQVIIDNEEMEGITGGMIDSREAEPGPIYLQGDHGPIFYRKMTIWPAKPAD